MEDKRWEGGIKEWWKRLTPEELEEEMSRRRKQGIINRCKRFGIPVDKCIKGNK